MNALNTLIGIGRGLDDVFTGGAGQRVHGTIKARNALGDVRDLALEGDLQGAQRRALEGNLIDPVNHVQTAMQQRSDAEAQENAIFSQLAIGLSQIQDPRARSMAFEAMKPGLSQRYGLDDEDFGQVPIGDAEALRLFGTSLITPQDQVSNELRGREADTAQFNADTGRINAATQRERLAFDQQRAPLDRQADEQKLRRETFKDEQSLRKEFTGITSDFRDTQSSIERIRSVADLGTSQGDLALIVAFTKLLDPGSVAREGEVQLTQRSASAIQQALNIRNQFVEGQTILPDAVRNSFKAAAEEIFSQYEKSFANRVSEYTSIAQDSGLNPQRVVVGSNERLTQQAAQQASGGGQDLSAFSDEALERIANGGR